MPPGVHGPKGYPRLTAYGTQLLEKQKAKTIYGILERPFANIIAKAQRKVGDTGEHLINMLELRLDNVVFRCGLATTRRQARQLVNHGHILVDGKKINIPSALLKVGQVVTVKENSKSRPYFKTILEKLATYAPPQWLSLEAKIPEGKIIALPASLKDFKPLFDVKAVVEYYGR
jgi:small subunit ribosomal protein S4